MPTVEELQDRIAELEEIIGLTADFPIIVQLRERRGLMRLEARMLGLLIARPFVPYGCAYDALYGDRAELPKFDTLRTVVKRLRPYLAEIGVEISTVYGEGYFIDKQAKKKLLECWPELKRAA